MDRLYPTRQAAEILGLSPQTLRNLVHEGAFRPNETWRTSRTRRVFTETALQRFRDEQKARGEKLGPLFKRKENEKKSDLKRGFGGALTAQGGFTKAIRPRERAK